MLYLGKDGNAEKCLESADLIVSKDTLRIIKEAGAVDWETMTTGVFDEFVAQVAEDLVRASEMEEMAKMDALGSYDEIERKYE